MDIAEQLRTAVVEAGTYHTAKDSGVAYAVLLRFVNGERGINLATAAKVAETLGLELRQKSVAKPRRKR